MELVIKIATNNNTQMFKVIHFALNGNRVFARLVLSDLSLVKMVSVLRLAIIVILGIS